VLQSVSPTIFIEKRGMISKSFAFKVPRLKFKAVQFQSFRVELFAFKVQSFAFKVSRFRVQSLKFQVSRVIRGDEAKGRWGDWATGR
jgi:hypothetical protein